MTEIEIVGWHHRLDGHKFEHVLDESVKPLGVAYIEVFAHSCSCTHRKDLEES